MNDLYLILRDLAVWEAGVLTELGEVGLNGLCDVADGELLVHDVGDLGQVLLGLGVDDERGDVCVNDCLNPPTNLAERRLNELPGALYRLAVLPVVHRLYCVNPLEPLAKEPKEVL